MASEAVEDRRGHDATSKVINAVVRGVARSSEMVNRGIVAVINSGKKQSLPDINNGVLLLPACTLAEKIRTGQLRSVDVVKAYIDRIREVNPAINAVVDSRFKEALEEALKVDQLVQSGIKTPQQLAESTPFLGVPFSSKEAVLVKGLSATCGLVCRKDMKAHSDSGAVDRLRKAGAIPLVVTNTSEVCMHWESYNNLHGQTNNPYDTSKTAGGSSGGEAALLGAAGSIMGLGTDLGGSIRLPSFFCGVFGHKPSRGIVPIDGLYPPMKEQASEFAVTGPMARYATDLRQMIKVLGGKEISRQLKLDEPVNFKCIKVYYMLNDGGNPIATPVSSEIRDCLRKVLSWLKNLGIRTEAVRLRGMKYGMFMWGRNLCEIKDQTIADLMTGDVKTADEIVPPHQEILKWLSGRSDHTFPVIFNACVQRYFAPTLLSLFHVYKRISDELKTEMQELLGEDGVFLYPTFPTVAQYHGELLLNAMNMNYAVIFNALGFPVTQCSVGVGPSGLPVGFQVAAGPMNDRLTLTFAEEVERKFGGWVKPSAKQNL